MILFRRIQEHRPVVVLTVLCALSLLSLITETQASLLRRGIERAVNVTAYPFLKLGNMVSRGSSHAYHFVADHGLVFDENAVLREENVRLKTRLAQFTELSQENARLRDIIGFAQAHPELTVLPAKVIQSSEGMLTIDRGSVHGLSAPMSVVASDGVVGILTEVGDFTSKVATLHHRDCRIGAMVRRNRLRAYDGMIRASNTFRVLCTLEYIDLNSDVRAGDEIVTSPESIFPADCPIGVIQGPPRSSGPLWRSADVRPYVDPYRLDEVLVLLRAAPDTEAFAGPYAGASQWTAPGGGTYESRADKTPDLRPLQERFAP